MPYLSSLQSGINFLKCEYNSSNPSIVDMRNFSFRINKTFGNIVERSTFIIAIAATVLFCTGCTSRALVNHEYKYRIMDRQTKNVHKKTERFIRHGISAKYSFPINEKTFIEQVSVDRKKRQIDVYFSKHFSYIPLRPENVATIYTDFRNNLTWPYSKYNLTLYSLGEPIDNLVPNMYLTGQNRDQRRLPKKTTLIPAPVTNLSRKYSPEDGLLNHSVALWPSHGWYYDNIEKHWSWQRPRLFQTVEDIYPMSFTLNYLIPMLENAGANVFTPRERDIQVNEVIIDNDSRDADIHYREITFTDSISWRTSTDTAFAVGNPPYSGNQTPFRLGTHRIIMSDTLETARAEWLPEIPESGLYSVQITYQSSDSSANDVNYSVYHAGGQTDFKINQQIGGGTWIYLGKFQFEAGIHPESGRVVLSNKSDQPGKIISADAVKFGGGMGNVARGGQISRRPRYLEAARYYLQYAGIHDTLVYNLQADTMDYTDDYQSRGEWVNYLRGAPYGPNRNRMAAGLGIPIDVSLAFHTDAGITFDKSTIGTLAIYSYEDIDSNLVFPDSASRLVNRDLADIMQTQIVEDIRYKYDPNWTRRALMNAEYSEAYRPNVPSVLIELLSHQNYRDMQLGNDPNFKFDASRAMYKAILKFIAVQYNRDYCVQPLPVTHFQTGFNDSSGVRLTWKPSLDPLEPTAQPQGYIIYSRKGNGAFDNGYSVTSPETQIENLTVGIIYSFKITAYNSGGESFPSEILSICRQPNDSLSPILIVNGFDRISAPATIETESMTGFSYMDQGVADKYDISYTGAQYDFDPLSPFISNIHPGHGASWADYETRIIPGNSFDFPFNHGAAIKDAGRSFISISDEVFADNDFVLHDYTIIDFILGEERETDWFSEEPNQKVLNNYKTFPPPIQQRLIDYLHNGGSLFVSGAYVGTDLLQDKQSDNPDHQFARDTLKFDWLRDQAVRTGDVFSSDSLFAPLEFDFTFNTRYDPKIYTAESTDALLPIADQSATILRYDENHYGAAIGYKDDYGLVIFGFPFETITTNSDRNAVMAKVIEYLEGDFSTVKPQEEEILDADIDVVPE